VSIWAGTTGFLDDVPIEDVGRFEHDFLDYLKRQHAGALQAIRETGELTEDTITTLKDAIEDFRKSFETSSGTLLGGDEQAEPLEEEGQETIARRVPPPQKAETN
jgi:F-type H+/Na+-transporting ATPase subunit alpha